MAEFRKLNEKGLGNFAAWIASGAAGSAPLALLHNPETSDKLPASIRPGRHDFKDRLHFGAYLVDLLRELEAPVISRDVGLWSALALIWFDLLCPQDKEGNRKVDKEYRYILSGSFLTYYRHLVRTPWQLYRDHGENARFMLVRSRDVTHPLSVHGEILEQFGGRQRVMGSKPIIRAANRMYIDPATGKPRRGVAGSGPGAALRFGKVVRQLDLTFDPEVMSPDEFIGILPKEFRKWRELLATDAALEAAE